MLWRDIIEHHEANFLLIFGMTLYKRISLRSMLGKTPNSECIVLIAVKRLGLWKVCSRALESMRSKSVNFRDEMWKACALLKNQGMARLEENGNRHGFAENLLRTETYKSCLPQVFLRQSNWLWEENNDQHGFFLTVKIFFWLFLTSGILSATFEEFAQFVKTREENKRQTVKVYWKQVSN